MKKLVVLSLALVLLVCGFFNFTAFGAESGRLFGDPDNDGVVAVTDATLIQQYIAQIVVLDDEAKRVADIDGDGNVTIIDCTGIQQFVAKLISEFPGQPSENDDVQISTNSGLQEGTLPTTPTETETQESSTEVVDDGKPSQYELDVLELTNIEREKVGLEPLEFAYFIYDCAKFRAKEADSYFSHTRPDGTPWYTVFGEMNVAEQYNTAGENLAWGHTDAYDVVCSKYGWMNSPGHKANILNPNFKYVAIASCECADQKGTYCTVQLFWG